MKRRKKKTYKKTSRLFLSPAEWRVAAVQPEMTIRRIVDPETTFIVGSLKCISTFVWKKYDWSQAIKEGITIKVPNEDGEVVTLESKHKGEVSLIGDKNRAEAEILDQTVVMSHTKDWFWVYDVAIY